MDKHSSDKHGYILRFFCFSAFFLVCLDKGKILVLLFVTPAEIADRHKDCLFFLKAFALKPHDQIHSIIQSH